MNAWKFRIGLLCATLVVCVQTLSAGEAVRLRVTNRFEYPLDVSLVTTKGPVFVAKLQPGASWTGSAQAGQLYRAANNTVKHPAFEFTVPAGATATWNIGGSASAEDEGMEDHRDPQPGSPLNDGDDSNLEMDEPDETGAVDDEDSTPAEAVEAEAEGEMEPVPTVQLIIVNSFRHSLKIYWLDENDQRVQYAELKPGQRWVVDTYAGHRWVAANETVKHPSFQYEVPEVAGEEPRATWTIRP